MPIVISQKAQLTADEIAVDEAFEKFTELFEGELIQTQPTPFIHNRVASRFADLFREFAELSDQDLTFGGSNDGFLVERNPDSLLSPHASMMLRRPGMLDTTWLEFSPEIALEVLSSQNPLMFVIGKKRKYFAAGTDQIWIADVDNQTLEIHFRDGRRLTATEDAEVECEGIAQGLVVKLAEVFAPIE